MNSLAIGIDFGTTKTLVTYPSEEGRKPEIAHLGRERNSLPTSAFISESGTWEFGDDADDYACDGASAERYVSHFKLQLGSSRPALQLFNGQSFSSFSARDVTAEYLRYIRTTCEKEVFNGHAITQTVITHPVHFSPAQIADLRRAAENAGFSDVKLVREPESAGWAFCCLCPKDVFNGTALVVDWGGGTLDLALVSREKDRVKVHNNYVIGRDAIGGVIFDDLLWKYVAERMLQEHGISLTEDSIDHIRLQKKKIRAAKEKLSRTETVILSLSGNRGAYPTLKLSRTELESTLRPQIETGIADIQNLLARIKEQSLRPTQVLLIGGSSQIPLISKLIEEMTGLPCRRWQYSHEAVALGAIIQKTSAPSHDITLALTDEERSKGCEKRVTIKGMSLLLSFPAHIENGQRICFSSEETALESDVFVTIRQAPTIILPLSGDELKNGGKKTIIVGEIKHEVTIPKNARDGQTCSFHFDEIGSVIVHLQSQTPTQTASTQAYNTFSLALTEKERREGIKKIILVNHERLSVNIPKGVSVGTKLRLLASATGYAEDIYIEIEDAPTIDVILTEHEIAHGGEKRISYKGNSYTIEIPNDARPDTIWIYDFIEFGSIFVHFVSQNAPSHTDAAYSNRLLKEAKEQFNHGKYESAFNLYLQSAQLGNTEAQYKVACRYAHGQGVTKNMQEALTWSRRAALAGNEDAGNLYRRLLSQGTPSSQEAEYAYKLLKEAKEYFNCGKYEAAFNLYLQSAQLGNTEAQYKIACRYAYGQGVTRDIYEALNWSRRAALAGNEDARNLYIRLTR